MKAPNQRWRKEDKEKAYAILRWKPVIVLVIVVILAIGSHVVPYIVEKSNRKQADINFIVDLIAEHRPEYDPVYAHAAAKYLVENAYPFNARYLACKVLVESGFYEEAESNVKAKGYFQILETRKEMRARKKDGITDPQFSHWAYQLDKAKYDRLLPAWDEPNTGKLTPFNRLHAMELDWFGGRTTKGECEANKAIARLYTELVMREGLIWQKEPCEKKEKTESAEEVKK